MKISSLTITFATIMLHVLLLLTAYTLRDNRTMAVITHSSNFLGASTYSYEYSKAFNANEDRTMRVLIPNKYK